MRRKVLVGLAVLTVIGVGAGVVFAQEATFNKFVRGQNSWSVRAAGKDIRGEVVISGKMGNTNISAIDRSGFDGCTQITSVVLSDAVSSIGEYAFANCNRLSSVTFGSSGRNFSSNAFPGDLRDKYKVGGSGTYTRHQGSSEWFKAGRGGGGGGGGHGGVAVGGPGVPPPPPPRGGPPPRSRTQYCKCCGQPLPD